MSNLKSNLIRKKIGEKNIIHTPLTETVYVIEEPIKKIIRDKNYRTNGESLIVVKDTDLCNLTLDVLTTNHIIIKALTKVIIKPSKNFIDEYYTEIEIDKGACVEFYLLEDTWYIVSSDGLKLGL